MLFTKMYTCRHDMILIDGFKEPLEPADLSIAYLCNRRVGIGGDMLVLAGPSAIANVQILCYNADGSPITLCGDAIRCAAKFMYDNGRVTSNTLTIDTADGIKQALVTPSQSAEAYSVTVDMGVPRFITPPIYNPYLGLECVRLGDQYLILEESKLNGAPVDTLGKKLSNDPSLDNGIDVCFVTVVKPNLLMLRVWKHNSGEAHSDGTAAAAAAAMMMGNKKCDNAVTVRMSGGDVSVCVDDNGHLFLTGPVSYAYKGEM